jgi:HSP20 family protein
MGQSVSSPHLSEETTTTDLYFTTDLFSQFDRLHQQTATLFSGHPSSIRTDRLSAFPLINVGTTDDTIEIVAFAPGIDPEQMEVSIDKGPVMIAGARAAVTRQLGEATRHFIGQKSRKVATQPPHREARLLDVIGRGVKLPAKPGMVAPAQEMEGVDMGFADRLARQPLS